MYEIIFLQDTILHSNINAQTSSPNNYVIEIKVNPNRFNRPDLDIARTLIHETIHAEIFRKLLSLSNRNGAIDLDRIGQMLQRGDFPGLLDYYTRHVKNVQHEQMAAHYIKVIADMLQEFDNQEHSRQFYEDISWGGLMGYGKPFNHNTGLYPNSTKAWIDLGREERLRILKVRGDFLESYKN